MEGQHGPAHEQFLPELEDSSAFREEIKNVSTLLNLFLKGSVYILYFLSSLGMGETYRKISL